MRIEKQARTFFVCCSENSSISGQLLTDMLRFMDDLEIFDRSLGLNPFLILDGHGSRFELCFLEYINNEATKWNVCIGLPYGTSYWQVGDSSQQNGQFKMALTALKQALVTAKNDLQLEFCVEKREAIKLVKEARKKSFANIFTNKTAIANRGWGPRALNRCALLHSEILCTKPQDNASTPTGGQVHLSKLQPPQ